MTLTDWPAHVLSTAIHSREVSCREVMAATLARIERVNPIHHAVVSLRDGDALLSDADACDAQLADARSKAAGAAPPGWLHGIPQAIKDLAQTAGLRTTFGSPLLRDHIPAHDGLMVARMKAAGAIVIGKTNTPEFGLGSHTFNDLFGTTCNAYDPSKSAGGSSGGAAVALATRMLSVADGSDSMGSLRNPAAFNNVFGMRPSQGRVPFLPAADVWVTQLGTEGPMGRTVRDLALLLDVQSGYDERSPLSIAGHERFDGALDPTDGVDGVFGPRDGVDGVFGPRAARDAASGPPRIGWLGDLGGYLAVEPGILDVCAAGLKRLEGIGCRVDPIGLGTSPDQVWQTWLVWRRWIVAARIAPFLVDPANRARIKPEALWEFDQGQGLTGNDTMRASTERTAFHRHLLSLFGTHDVLALPSAQVWPFDASLRWPTAIAGRTMDTYHRWMEVTLYATLAGLPCISVPVGFSADGLPMGMQLIGRPLGDFALLRLAHAYEQVAGDVLARRPPEPA